MNADPMNADLPEPEKTFVKANPTGANALVIEDPAVSGWVDDYNNPRLSIQIRQQLQHKFEILIQRADTVCREDFYLFTHQLQVPVYVWFFPASQAFETYGPCLLVDISYGREIGQIETNHRAGPPVRSAGFLQGEYVSVRQLKHLSPARILRLRQEGFHTRDVYKISSA